jgi:hypothetical protein
MPLSCSTPLHGELLQKRDRISTKVTSIMLQRHQLISCREPTLKDLTFQLNEAIRPSNPAEDLHARLRLETLTGTNSASRTILQLTNNLLPSYLSPLLDMLKVRLKRPLTETEVNKPSMEPRLTSLEGLNKTRVSLLIFSYPSKSSRN